MIRNYLVTALRNLKRNKVFSFINILGLSLGMACSLLIMLWVQHERSIDAYNKDSKLIYQVYERQYYDNRIDGLYSTPALMPGEMKKTVPEIMYATPIAWNNQNTFEANNKILKVEGNHAGEDFFKIFSYTLLEGNASTALQSPLSIAISRKMAEEFFGSPEAAMGKTLRYENSKDLSVSAVFENLPEIASQKFDFLINWDEFLVENPWAKEWGNNGPRTIIKLRPDANPALLEKKLTHFLDAYNKQQGKGFRIELGIQRFDEAYLHSIFKDGKISGGRIEYVQLFSIVAIFILLIACINFMNLTTARSVKRAKEIGVRKVVGAVRSSLVRQFIGEAILISTFAAVVAMTIVLLLLPAFNHLTDKQIVFPFRNPIFWGSLLGLTLLTGFVSGSYPALLLSGFNPISVLKGSGKVNTGSVWFRKGLVVFQFTLSIVLIIGTLLISKQVDYCQSINLGYERENLVYIPMDGDLPKKYPLFKDQAMKTSGIQSITRMNDSPTEIDNGTGGVEWEGKDPNSRPMFTQTAVGYDFAKTMKLGIIAGRDYSKDFATDSVGYILNETALKKIGFKNPIGMPLTFWQKKGTVIGVIKDFHFNSLHEEIKPLVIRLGETQDWGFALVRIEGSKTKEALANLENICKDLNPKFPFTYQFSDEQYQKLYKSEQIVHELSNYFAFLGIFISCLGLLGLTMFTAEQRTKEISIRKVLGASVGSLFSLLSKEFLVLVIIAFVIASPLAWWAMNKWLQGFAYRVDFGWWMFAVAGIAAVIIALLTVSFQALKTSLANPMGALRSE